MHILLINLLFSFAFCTPISWNWLSRICNQFLHHTLYEVTCKPFLHCTYCATTFILSFLLRDLSIQIPLGAFTFSKPINGSHRTSVPLFSFSPFLPSFSAFIHHPNSQFFIRFWKETPYSFFPSLRHSELPPCAFLWELPSNDFLCQRYFASAFILFFKRKILFWGRDRITIDLNVKKKNTI